MNIIDFLTSSSVLLLATLTPLVVAITQIFKRWILSDKWYPLLSILIGILLAFFFSGIVEVSYRVLLGILAGLSASGLYSGVKTVKE